MRNTSFKTKYLIYIIVPISLYFISVQSVFGGSGDTDLEFSSAPKKIETIQDMQENIESLENEKIRLDFKWNTFLVGNETLGSLMKENLSQEEKDTIQKIVIEYTDSQDKYEGKLSRAIENGESTEQIKRDFYAEKKEFYMSLVRYIQIEKLESYAKYINSDLVYNEKSNDVATQIELKNQQRDDRIEEIQSQIDENTTLLRERIQDKVALRVRARLNEFIQQQKFQNLSNGGKIIMFEKLVSRVDEEVLKLENLVLAESTLQEKRFIYEIIKDILKEYIDDWK